MSVRDLLDEYGTMENIPEDVLEENGYIREKRLNGFTRIIKASKKEKQREKKESLVAQLRGPLRNHTYAHHRTYEKMYEKDPENVLVEDLEDAVKRSQWMKNEGVPPVFTPGREGRKRWIDDDGVEHNRFPTVDTIANIVTDSAKTMPYKMSYAAPTIPERMELLASHAYSNEQIEVPNEEYRSEGSEETQHVETSKIVKDVLLSEVERIYDGNFTDDSTKEYVLTKVDDVYDSLAEPLQDWAKSEDLNADVSVSPKHIGTKPFWFAFVDSDDIQPMLEEYKTFLSKRYANCSRGLNRYMRNSAKHQAMYRSPFNSASLRQDVVRKSGLFAINNELFGPTFTKDMFNALESDEQDELIQDYIEEHTPRPGDRARVREDNFEETFGMTRYSTLGEQIWSYLQRLDESEAARRDQIQDIRSRHPYATDQLQLDSSQLYEELDVQTRSNKDMYDDVLTSVQGRARDRITGVPYKNTRPQSIALGVVDSVSGLSKPGTLKSSPNSE